MKKLLVIGTILAVTPFVSFAQTSTTTDVQATGTAAVITTTVAPGLVPGDFFYFLDNWGENLRLAFTFNKESKAKLHLQYAKERVAEMKEVLKKPEAKLADIEDAKKNFDTQVADAAALVKGEKESGANVAGLAKDLSDELDQSRVELKDIFQGHQDNQGRAEAEIRTKINEITISGTASSTGAKEMKGLTQALEAITKEKDNASKEGNNLDESLSGDQALFDEVIGNEMEGQKHMDQAKRADGEMNVQGMAMPNASGTPVMMEEGGDINTGGLDNLEQGIKEGEKMMDNLGR